jgi:hypothetical protein
VIHDNPTKDTNRLHLFRANLGSEPGPQALDTTEEIELVTISKAAIPEMIRAGHIRVAGTIALCFLALGD